MGEPFPPDYHRIVRKHASMTTGYVLGELGRCREFREWEFATRERLLERLDARELATFAPRGSWHLTALVCSPEVVEALADWFRSRSPGQVERLYVVFVDGADEDAAIRAWSARGLPPVRTTRVRDQFQFQQRFGRALNDQIYRDAKRGVPGGPLPMNVVVSARPSAKDVLTKLTGREAALTSPRGSAAPYVEPAATVELRSVQAEDFCRLALAAVGFRLPESAVNERGEVRWTVHAAPEGKPVPLTVTLRLPAPESHGHTAPRRRALLVMRQRFGVTFGKT